MNVQRVNDARKARAKRKSHIGHKGKRKAHLAKDLPMCDENEHKISCSSIPRPPRIRQMRHANVLCETNRNEVQLALPCSSSDVTSLLNEYDNSQFMDSCDDQTNVILEHELFTESENEVPLDFGYCNHSCIQCGALVWYEERSEKSIRPASPNFSICCMKGKVQLPQLTRPPPLLRNLFMNLDSRSAHFLDNVRLYNNMFAFTSIGGKVETSSNDGHGPPQFVLSGQNYHRIGCLLPINGQKPKFA